MVRTKYDAPTHFELQSEDPQATRQFFETVFGWTFQERPETNYTLVKTPSIGGGLLKAEGTPPGVTNYIHVKDIDRALEKVTAEGGEVIMPKDEVPEAGFFAVFRAPGNIVQGLWQEVAAPRTARRSAPTKRKTAAKRKTTRRRRR